MIIGNGWKRIGDRLVLATIERERSVQKDGEEVDGLNSLTTSGVGEMG